MVLLRGRHRFRASALSLAVPLEGTETVVGLRELQRRTDGYNLARALNLDAIDGRDKPRSWRKRYKGPFLTDLAPDDLRKEPLEWRPVLWGQGWHTYNVPESLEHVCERTEENLMTYLPNYLRFLMLLTILAMLLRPWSLLGALSVAGCLLFRLTVAARPLERSLPLSKRFWWLVQSQYAQAQAAVQQQQGGGQAAAALQQQQQAATAQAEAGGADALQSVLQLLCYILLIYCNTLGALARALLWWSVAMTAHASLRRSPTEYAQALREPDVARSGGLAAVSGHSQVPGVAFVEVVGWRQGPSKDPHRVLREAWELVASIAGAAAAYCWHALQFYCYRTWLRVRTFAASALHV